MGMSACNKYPQKVTTRYISDGWSHVGSQAYYGRAGGGAASFTVVTRHGDGVRRHGVGVKPPRGRLHGQVDLVHWKLENI